MNMESIEVVYVPELDITIIVDHKLGKDEPLEILNFYYGKPNYTHTEYYIHNRHVKPLPTEPE